MRVLRSSAIVGMLSIILMGCGSDSRPEPAEVRFQRPEVPPSIGSRLESPQHHSIIISEFMAENDSTIRDAAGEYSDWIELYNYGETPVDLKGWALTDDSSDPSKWVFPERVLEPGEYLVVFASGNGGDRDGDLTCSFRLSSGGEFLGLMGPEGDWVHRFDPAYPKQKSDLSYGIASDWERDDTLLDFEGYFLSPSPGQANSEIMVGEVENVEWSVPSGVYQAPIAVHLSSKTRDAKIYYSLDGSVPGIDSGTLYRDPLAISKDSVVKVRAVKPGFRPSGVAVASYIFKDQSPGEANLDLAFPIISLSLSPSDLNQLSDSRELTGKGGEFQVSIEWLDLGTDRQWSIDGGIRMGKLLSRILGEKKPSYRLYFRDEYGPSKLKENLFGSGATSVYDRLDLVAVDSVFDAMWRHFGRGLIGSAQEPFLRGKWCQVYLNGRFQGLYEVVERPDLQFAVSYFDGKASDFDLIGHGTKTDSQEAKWYNVLEGDPDGWVAMVSSVGKDPDDDDFNARVRPALLELDHWIRFVLLTSFTQGGLALAEAEWIAIRNRKADPGFRFVMRDGMESHRWDSSAWSESMAAPGLGLLWAALIRDEEFRVRVKDHVYELMFADGILSSEGLQARAQRELEVATELVRADMGRWTSPVREREVANLKTKMRERLVEARSGLLAWLQSLDLVPELGGIEWSLPSRPVPVGSSLVLGASQGEIYYTTDGSDPRARGGAVRDGAMMYQSPIKLLDPVIVTCRVRSGAVWGPLERRAIDVGDGLN